MAMFSTSLLIALAITVSGCLMGEAVRLRYLTKWLYYKPLWFWAAFAGVALPTVNLFIYLCEVSVNMEPLKLINDQSVLGLAAGGFVAYAAVWILMIWGYRYTQDILHPPGR